jgi:hypothetical protein
MGTEPELEKLKESEVFQGYWGMMARIKDQTSTTAKLNEHKLKPLMAALQQTLVEDRKMHLLARISAINSKLYKYLTYS